MNKLLMLVSALCLLSAPAAATVVDYGWEDAGTIIGQYSDIDAFNVPLTTDPVHSGNFSLKLVDQALSGTPQAYVAALWNLRDGDVITVGFWRYDDTPDASPSVRIWGHWNDELPGNIDGYSGSAGGNYDYGLGLGWDYTDFEYTVVDGHTGLIIEARTYSNPGDTVWLDDLHIEAPDHVMIMIPGCSPVGIEEETWGGVKALFQ